MTQRTYFNGRYIGCDINTSLRLPIWESLFKEWGVPVFSIDQSAFESNEYVEELEKNGVAAFIVKISPEQKYLPKISSRVLENGSRGSNPLHLMTLQLTEKLSKMFLNI